MDVWIIADPLAAVDHLHVNCRTHNVIAIQQHKRSDKNMTTCKFELIFIIYNSIIPSLKYFFSKYLFNMVFAMLWQEITSRKDVLYKSLEGKRRRFTSIVKFFSHYVFQFSRLRFISIRFILTANQPNLMRTMVGLMPSIDLWLMFLFCGAA